MLSSLLKILLPIEEATSYSPFVILLLLHFYWKKTYSFNDKNILWVLFGYLAFSQTVLLIRYWHICNILLIEVLMPPSIFLFVYLLCYWQEYSHIKSLSISIALALFPYIWVFLPMLERSLYLLFLYNGLILSILCFYLLPKILEIEDRGLRRVRGYLLSGILFYSLGFFTYGIIYAIPLYSNLFYLTVLGRIFFGLISYYHYGRGLLLCLKTTN